MWGLTSVASAGGVIGAATTSKRKVNDGGIF